MAIRPAKAVKVATVCGSDTLRGARTTAQRSPKYTPSARTTGTAMSLPIPWVRGVWCLHKVVFTSSELPGTRPYAMLSWTARAVRVSFVTPRPNNYFLLVIKNG